MKNKKAFTLVELLAVIVILAVILVIAVPQVLDVIDTTKVGSLESSAKLIANSAEKKYAEFLALGKDTSTIKCSDVTKLNDKDYGTCTIKFDENGKATVSIKGKDDGKFEGLKCEGTKDNMVCGDITPLPVINCSFTPIKEDIIEENIRIYTVKDYDACMTYLKSTVSEEELTDEILNQADSMCKGNGIPEYGKSTSEIFKNMISGSTELEQELIDLNVINVSFVKYIIKDYDACMTYLKSTVSEEELTDEILNRADSICKGNGIPEYGKSTSEIFEEEILIDHISEQELIDLNVINVEKIINPELRNGTEYVNGQYTYMYMQELNINEGGWTDIFEEGWGVTLTDKESTEDITSEVCTYINDKPIVSMSGMFAKSNATLVDLSSFNTSNVTNMSRMFYNTKIVTKLYDDGLSFNENKFNLVNINNNLNNYKIMTLDTLPISSGILDLSNFDTSNVTNMRYMFNGSKATSIDLSSFNTSNVTDMGYMFSGSAATRLDLSNFDTSNVTSVENMFCNAACAKTVDISHFDLSKATDASSILACRK